MKNLIFFLLTCLVVFSACPGGKECDCQHCNNDCQCEPWAYDINGGCDGLYRDLFAGNYATVSSFCDGSFPQGTALSCSRGNGDDDINIQFGGTNTLFSLNGIIAGTTVSIPEQSSQGASWSGSGSLSGSLLTLTITRKRAGETDCVFNIQGTK